MDFSPFQLDKRTLPPVDTEPAYGGFSEKDLHEISEKAFAIESIDANLVATMFGVPPNHVKKRDVKFLKEYIRFVGPEYVKAYIQSLTRKNLSHEAAQHEIHSEVQTLWKGFAYHDIAHTMVNLFRGQGAHGPASLIPDFLKSENPNSVRHVPDEIFAALWAVFPQKDEIKGGIPAQMKHLTALIEGSKTFDEFYISFVNDVFTHLVPKDGQESDHTYRATKRHLEEKRRESHYHREPALVLILKDIYKNYHKNPRLLLDAFISRAKNLLD